MKKLFPLLLLLPLAVWAQTKIQFQPTVTPVKSTALQVSIGTNINSLVDTPQPFTVTASLNGTTSGISSVTFSYSGPGTLNFTPASGFNTSVTPTNQGTYEITANVTFGGVFTNSASVVLNVTTNIPTAPNVPPTVSILTPTNGQGFTAGTNISLTATASDSDGTVTNVAYYYDLTNLIGNATSNPYSFTWSNVAAGAYSLTAVATDNGGATGTSSSKSVTSTPTNSYPTVSITSPSGGASFTHPASITINATASDTDGTIASVAFYAEGVLIDTDTSSPFSTVWVGGALGTYSLTAKATDDDGAETTSSSVQVTINPPPNQPPTVSILTPTNGLVFLAPSNILFTASASDSDGTVTNVSYYYALTNFIGRATNSPYSFTWSNVAVGTYTLTAIASDDDGATATSSSVTITGDPTNSFPIVSLTAPTNGASYTAPATVVLTATASDSDGTIANVKFYNGGTLLNTDTGSPYTYTWSSVAAGTYSLSATATDDDGATSSSSTVSITVSDPPNTPPTVSITSPANGANFAANPYPPGSIFVSPSGSAGGDGSFANPLDMVTAMKGTNTIATNGVTVLFRGGTYSRGTNYTYWFLNGSSGNPVTIRSYPGETAIIDGHIEIGRSTSTTLGSWLDIRDLHFTSTTTNRVFNSGDDGVSIFAPSVVFVNNRVYDCNGTGVNIWDGATNITFQGNVLTANGVYDMVDGRPRGHGVYTQNPTTVLRLFENNIVIGNYDQGIQIYSGGASYPQYYRLRNNIVADNGWHTNPVSSVVDAGHYFVDALSPVAPVKEVYIETNYFFHPLQLAAGVLLGDNTAGTPLISSNANFVGNYQFGGDPALNSFYLTSGVFTNNYIVAFWRVLNVFTNGYSALANLNFNRNTYISFENSGSSDFIYNGIGKTFAQWQALGFDANSTYSTTIPTNSTKLVVIPDTYTTNRAHLAIYNYTTATSVAIPIDAVIAVGTEYDIRNAFSWEVVLTGTYGGGSVTLPMTGGDPVSGNMFQAFVLIPRTTPTYGGSVPITATASDSDGTVTKVEFYNGATLIGTDTTSPYAFTWTGVPVGSYSLTAKATDNLSATTVSSPAVGVTVGANQAPVTQITSPQFSKYFLTNTYIGVTATASDPDGTVADFRIYKDGVDVISGSSPLTYAVGNLPFGRYTFTSVAVDNNGLSTTSAPVMISTTNAAYTFSMVNYDYTHYSGTSSQMVFRAEIPSDLTYVRTIYYQLAGTSGDTRNKGTTAPYKEFLHAAGALYLGVQYPATPPAQSNQIAAALAAIASVATASGRPEINNAPFLCYGFSAGGSNLRPFIATNVNSMVGILDASGAWGVAGSSTTELNPSLYTLPFALMAGSGDTAATIAGIDYIFRTNRWNGAQTAYFTKQTNGHVDVYLTLGIPFLWEALKARYPMNLSNTIAKPLLVATAETNGWLMQNLSYSNTTTSATITNYAAMSGNPRTNSWFLNEATANYFSAFAQYSKKITIYSPSNNLNSTPYVDIFTAGTNITVSVDISGFPNCTNLVLRNGATIVGTKSSGSALSSPQTFAMTNLQSGLLMLTCVGRNTSGVDARSNPVYSHVKTPGPGPQYQ